MGLKGPEHIARRRARGRVVEVAEIITGVPTHYKKDESYRSIGLALGEVDSVDVDNGRVRVRINVDEPLQFKRKAGYANGDVISVTLNDEELHRYCYTCKRISHEEGTCPELSLEQRESNRIARLKQKEKEELAAREAFSVPIRGFETHARIDSQARFHRTYDLDRKPLDSHMHKSDCFKTEQKQNPDHDDLGFRISGKIESLARTVWNRLDHNYAGKVPRDRERYHPYQNDLRADFRYTKRITETPIKQGRYGDSASSSSWRVKGSSPQNQNRVQERSREWRRPNPPSRSNRSPDSQRTISEPHRILRSDPPRRRIGQYSSYEPRLEWQPVRVATRSREEQHQEANEHTNEQEMERETEEDRRRRIKGKAIARNPGDKEGNGFFDGGASGTLKINEPLPNKVTVPKEIPVTQGNTIHNIQSTQSQERGLAAQKTPTSSSPEQAEKRDSQSPISERLKIGLMGKHSSAQDTDLLTEEEINQIADQYASVDFDMDEDMLNEDDLLDEELEENTVIPETQEFEMQSNLPQREEDRAGRDVRKEKEKERLTTKTPRPAASKEQELTKKAQKDMRPPISINKHRGTRSPDTKGAAASKKLAIRGPYSKKTSSRKSCRGRGDCATRGKDLGATTEILKSTHYKGRGRNTEEGASQILERATHLLRSCCLPILRFFLDRSHLLHSSMLLWVKITGVPTHYKKDESYRSIGLALGEVDSVDVDNGRVRVRINVDEPLQFKRKAGYANGDVISVTLNDEELHRYCYTCKRISHEEEKEELAAREAFSVPIRGFETHARIDSQARFHRTYDLDRKPLDSHMHRSDCFKTEQKQNPDHDDLGFRISGKRESLARTVWNRLDHNYAGKVPRDRERYHPYQNDLRADSRYTKRITETPIKQGRYGDSASSSSWRVKGSSPQNQNRVQERSREWRRPNPPSRSNRSPDSQRTISEPHRILRSDPPRRRIGQYSSYEPRLEWQPVRVATRSREEQHQGQRTYQ
ncbi:hypothetical protein IGI04_015729 [Brassica rapa subsp. trilocularis]|uniref:Zinc knuckle CX2CX4HX4C domain-containing protein n=1 Tax=Brassica rapa subsp. trilocularis TaxID=1813537 RepID=A0ABQ7MR47_BRACM|nr:hypothetical protein IGI04_015729 [Brassica rapa subsp. trilocularis]